MEPAPPPAAPVPAWGAVAPPPPPPPAAWSTPDAAPLRPAPVDSDDDFVVPEGLAEQVVATIAKTARTDKIGDGKIFVLDVESALRVRTGETDDDAL